jgi:AraC-like DNA-binding protein
MVESNMRELLTDDFVPKIAYHVFRKCNPDWQIRDHYVTDHDLTYIIKGKARYTINGTSHELGSGDLLYLNVGDIKSAQTYSGNLMHCFGINFISKYPSKKTPVQPDKHNKNGKHDFPMVSHIGIRQDIIDLFRELTISWNEQQQGYITKTRALLMLIISRLAEIIIHDNDSSSDDYRISKITRYISMHYSEKLSVKNLAQEINLDEDYFGHLFKRKTGMTVHQYITKIRIRNAENILQSGNYKIYEAAEQCGFCDVFHFYKSFKALRGFPPSRCIPRK